MMSVWIAVDIWMIVAVIIDWIPAFTRTGVPMIVRPSVEKWIIPPVPEVACHVFCKFPAPYPDPFTPHP